MFLKEINESHKKLIGAPAGGPNQAFIYETMLQELEAEVRGHIRFQQQLKLHIETVENKVDQLESENAELTQVNQTLLEINKAAENAENLERETTELQEMQASVTQTLEELNRYREEQNKQFEKVKDEFAIETKQKNAEISEFK